MFLDSSRNDEMTNLLYSNMMSSDELKLEKQVHDRFKLYGLPDVAIDFPA